MISPLLNRMMDNDSENGGEMTGMVAKVVPVYA